MLSLALQYHLLHLVGAISSNFAALPGGIIFCVLNYADFHVFLTGAGCFRQVASGCVWVFHVLSLFDFGRLV